MVAPSNSGEPFKPAIAGYFCQKCGEDGLSHSGDTNGEYPGSLKSVRIICAEKVGPDLISQAFRYGADGVLICGCLIGNCETMAGNAEVLTHIHRSKLVLRDLGLEQGRLRQEWICEPGIGNLPALIAEFTEQVRALGPAAVKKDHGLGTLHEEA